LRTFCSAGAPGVSCGTGRALFTTQTISSPVVSGFELASADSS
jgi:hypothetical protein